MKQYVGLIKIKVVFLFILVLILILNGCNNQCKKDEFILNSEKEGQIILNELVKDLHEELNKPGLTEIEKIQIINKKVNSSIDWADKSLNESYNKDNCYNYYYFRDDQDRNKKCIRKQGGTSPEFVAFHKCGACGEYAELNNYLLNSFGFKSRIIGVPIKGIIHTWNEIRLNNLWIDNDASDYPTFKFNNSNNYKNTIFVVVEKGEEKFSDLTPKYNKSSNFFERKFYQIYYFLKFRNVQ